jgi:uncharacterized protein DUF6364
MRTTLSLDDNLLDQAKQRAARTGRTLSRVVEDALRETFGRRSEPGAAARIHLPTDPGDGRGLRPGVDLDDSAALLDVLEGDDAPL